MLADARKAAAGESSKVRSGQDPRGARRPDSLRALIDRYLEHAVASLRPRAQLESRRHLLKHWTPLHDRPAAAITKAEIAEPAAGQGGERAAGRAALPRHTARLVRLGVRCRPDPGHTPVPSKRVLAVKEQSRERVLSLDELRAIWNAADPGCDYGVIMRLLMLTGQRREEVGGMRWSELDLDRGLWALPAERTNTGEAHVVPLSSQAVELLRGVERRPGRDNVFGNGRGSYSGWSRSKARLDGRAKVPDWRLHDLRRSLKSGLHELGISSDVTERILNHARRGVQKVYDRAQYLPARTRALQAWADHLLKGEPAKVITG